MRVVILFFVWCLLLVACWPVALLALMMAPVVWLVALPFRLAAWAVGGLLAFVRALFYLPARVLGGV